MVQSIKFTYKDIQGAIKKYVEFFYDKSAIKKKQIFGC